MVEIREPPKDLAAFEKLSWSQKAEVKRKFPAAYWQLIEQVRRKED